MNKCIIVVLLMVVGMGSSQTAWTVLEQMDLDERLNAKIDLMLGSSATDQAKAKAHIIEDLWNRGRFDEALALFPELAELTDVSKMAIGSAWREPLVTDEQTDWGDDVKISSRDSTYIVSFDVHYASGNFFVALLYNLGSFWRWTVNFSSDGGLTWSETYNCWVNYELKWLAASVLHDHCYVVYPMTLGLSANIMRFKAADGQQENFNNDSTYIEICNSGSSSFEEIALESFVSGTFSRLYFFGIKPNDELLFFWSDSSATTWNWHETGINYADRGLAACTNISSLYQILVSFISDGNYVNLFGLNTSGDWDILMFDPAGPYSGNTSVGAHHDTVVCAYDYSEELPTRIRTAWFYGLPGFDLYELYDTTACHPDVALKGGGGAAMAYQQTHPPYGGRYIWCDYHENWSSVIPIWFTDHLYQNLTDPSIKFINDLAYGIAYCGIDADWNYYAYFDREDWVGVDENHGDNIAVQNITLSPNPCKVHTVLSYTVGQKGRVNVSVFDITGRLVKNPVNKKQPVGEYSITMDNHDLSAGIYFIQVETSGGSAEKKMMIIR
jgi:hypothetical protein